MKVNILCWATCSSRSSWCLQHKWDHHKEWSKSWFVYQRLSIVIICSALSNPHDGWNAKFCKFNWYLNLLYEKMVSLRCRSIDMNPHPLLINSSVTWELRVAPFPIMWEQLQIQTAQINKFWIEQTSWIEQTVRFCLNIVQYILP